MNYKKAIGHKLGVLCVAAALVLGSGNTVNAFEEIETAVGALDYHPLVEWPVSLVLPEEQDAVTIFGAPVVSQQAMVQYIRARGVEPKINCSLEELVGYYYEEAGREGIRPDVALCQALKETGFFQYGNDVKPKQNNFCGLGATGNKNPGYTFMTPQRGVRAHIQHLLAYASTAKPQLPLVDPRYEILCKKYPQYHGAVQYWTGLNGRWAVPGTHYGQEILQLWQAAQRMAEATGSSLPEQQASLTADSSWQDYVTAGLQAVRRGDYERAIDCYDRAADLTKDSQQLAEIYLHTADVWRDWGFNDKAVKCYDKALKKLPDNEAALLGKAQILIYAKQYKQAIACYTSLLKQEPEHALALYNRGCVYALLQDNAKALADLQAATAKEPDNREISQRLAVVQAAAPMLHHKEVKETAHQPGRHHGH